MASVNKAIIIGNLTKDPELRVMPDGTSVCNISVATNETWKDKTTGEKCEATEFHRITFYRKLAEIAGQYLKKGSSVYIEGALKTRKWTDKEGVDRHTTEIVASEMKMLGSRSDAPAERPAAKPRPQTTDSKPFDDHAFEDDLPF